MKLEIKIQNLDKVRDALNKLSGAQGRQAYANAINDVAKKVQYEMRAELWRAFDRPTPYVANSPKRVEATPDNLSAQVLPTLDARNLPGRGGKIGVDQQKILQAQEFGGRRRDKKSEAVLRRAGILPTGWQTAIPDDSRGGPFPGSDDGHGNLSGNFLRSVLSYLKSFQAGQGNTQNMSDGAKDRVRQFGKGTISKRAQQQAGPFMGRRYFISYGKNESPYGAGIVRTDSELKYGRPRSAHIGPGIWAVQGVGRSAKVRAVLIFIKPGKGYTPRISMERIAKNAGVQEYLDRRVRARIRNLAEGKPA